MTSKRVSKKAPEKDTNWFDRDEHLPIRECECFCGAAFKSQARGIQWSEQHEKKKNGKVVRDKDSNVIMESVLITGCISLKGCPQCQVNRIKSFS